MTASKRESVTVDRDAIARAFVSRGDEVDQETLARVADAMAATAKAVFAAQGVDLRIERKQKASGRSGSGLVCRGSKADASRDGAVVMAGQGLPAPVSSEEGIVRLRKRAVKMPIEKWAGEVLGPMKTAEALGVRRSTLDNWRTRGEIIALPKGKAAHVIPMAQFAEGRPIPGIERVLEVAHGSASLAWSWLMTPHVDFDAKPPLRALSAGHVEAVCAAAERSIG